jgi:hypothetical protein
MTTVYPVVSSDARCRRARGTAHPRVVEDERDGYASGDDGGEQERSDDHGRRLPEITC